MVLVAVLVFKYVKCGRHPVYGTCILATLSFLVSTFFYEGLCNMVPLMLFSSFLFMSEKEEKYCYENTEDKVPNNEESKS